LRLSYTPLADLHPNRHRVSPARPNPRTRAPTAHSRARTRNRAPVAPSAAHRHHSGAAYRKFKSLRCPWYRGHPTALWAAPPRTGPGDSVGTASPRWRPFLPSRGAAFSVDLVTLADGQPIERGECSALSKTFAAPVMARWSATISSGRFDEWHWRSYARATDTAALASHLTRTWTVRRLTTKVLAG